MYALNRCPTDWILPMHKASFNFDDRVHLFRRWGSRSSSSQKQTKKRADGRRHAAAVRPHGRMRLPTDSCPRVGPCARVSGNSFNGNHPTEKGLRNFGTKIQTGLEASKMTVYRSAEKSSIAVPLTCFSINLWNACANVSAKSWPKLRSITSSLLFYLVRKLVSSCCWICKKIFISSGVIMEKSKLSSGGVAF